MKYILDTHTWIWWTMKPEKLSEKVLNLISDTKQYEELLLSAISPWEFCKLLEKKRLTISCNAEDWIEKALDVAYLKLVPLSPKIAYRSTTLPQPFHTDPADQIVVATAREENAILITLDRKIQAYPHVKSFW